MMNFGPDEEGKWDRGMLEPKLALDMGEIGQIVEPFEWERNWALDDKVGWPDVEDIPYKLGEWAMDLR
jgi:hypothetical protein